MHFHPTGGSSPCPAFDEHFKINFCLQPLGCQNIRARLVKYDLKSQVLIDGDIYFTKGHKSNLTYRDISYSQI